jgi:ABC-type sulfate transport system substrate-binding protein
MISRRSALAPGLSLGLTGASGLAYAADVTLLNVSYDPTRELYQEFNAAFAKHWKAETGDNVTIKQSHGGYRQTGPRRDRGSRSDVEARTRAAGRFCVSTLCAIPAHVRV